MFITKRTLQKIEQDIDSLEYNKHHHMYDTKIVSCETCGCLLYENTAKHKEDRIEEQTMYDWRYDRPIPNKVKAIVTNYYCGRCTPKVKK